MSTHTPGPWIEGEATRDNWYIYAEEGLSRCALSRPLPRGMRLVASLERSEDGSKEWRNRGTADARLIAAAPALLAALSNLVANEHGVESVKATCYREARAAIAQARGETK
jgi:hypothetical protein